MKYFCLLLCLRFSTLSSSPPPKNHNKTNRNEKKSCKTEQEHYEISESQRTFISPLKTSQFHRGGWGVLETGLYHQCSGSQLFFFHNPLLGAECSGGLRGGGAPGTWCGSLFVYGMGSTATATLIWVMTRSWEPLH